MSLSPAGKSRSWICTTLPNTCESWTITLTSKNPGGSSTIDCFAPPAEWSCRPSYPPATKMGGAWLGALPKAFFARPTLFDFVLVSLYLVIAIFTLLVHLKDHNDFTRSLRPWTWRLWMAGYCSVIVLELLNGSWILHQWWVLTKVFWGWTSDGVIGMGVKGLLLLFMFGAGFVLMVAGWVVLCVTLGGFGALYFKGSGRKKEGDGLEGGVVKGWTNDWRRRLEEREEGLNEVKEDGALIEG